MGGNVFLKNPIKTQPWLHQLKAAVTGGGRCTVNSDVNNMLAVSVPAVVMATVLLYLIASRRQTVILFFYHWFVTLLVDDLFLSAQLDF